MTTPTPTPPVRPAQVQSGAGTNRSTPFNAAKLRAWGLLMLELVLAQVAMALANISVLGVHPFEFLKGWGMALEQQASDAYTKAQTAQDTSQGTIDVIIGGLTDDPGTTGNSNDILGAVIGGFRAEVDQVTDLAGGAFSLARQLSQQLLSIIQKSETTIITPVAQVINAFAFWTFGWFWRTEQAHTPQNAAIASLRGEMNAKFAAIATGTTGWVDNFDAPGYSLATNYATAPGEASSTLGSRDGTNTVLQPPAGVRATMYRTVACDTGHVDLEMAISNLAQKGRAALWIGASSVALSGGLASGTLLVRIDNGFSDPTKQRLQIFTVTGTGNLASHGTLYSVDFGTWHDGDLIRLRKDETSQIHRVYVNNVEATNFDDHLTNLVTVGGGRIGGWRQNIDASSTSVGPDLDLIHLYDWTT